MNKRFRKIIERKIRYDSTIIEHKCLLLKAQNQQIVLFHKIQNSFTMTAEKAKLTIPKGSYTIAHYWIDRPYNVYIWRDNKGNYLGSYFNLVRNTFMTDQFVSFEDMIIDIMVLPNGDYFILDEDEVPVPLDQFENGFVQHSLNALMEWLDILHTQLIFDTETTYRHEEFLPFLDID